MARERHAADQASRHTVASILTGIEVSKRRIIRVKPLSANRFTLDVVMWAKPQRGHARFLRRHGTIENFTLGVFRFYTTYGTALSNTRKQTVNVGGVRHHFRTHAEARAAVVPWCQDFYNVKRRHSSAALLAPDEYERTAAIQLDAA